jgi:uncharacterized protein (UPF0147 family)
MTPSVPPTVAEPAAPMPAAEPVPVPGSKAAEVARVLASLHELAEDTSVPRNIRRGAQSAREALQKPQTALDVRVASAVYVLDDLANDSNIPTHGRTAIWSIMSTLESLQ